MSKTLHLPHIEKKKNMIGPKFKELCMFKGFWFLLKPSIFMSIFQVNMKNQISPYDE